MRVDLQTMLRALDIHDHPLITDWLVAGADPLRLRDLKWQGGFAFSAVVEYLYYAMRGKPIPEATVGYVRQHADADRRWGFEVLHATLHPVVIPLEDATTEPDLSP